MNKFANFILKYRLIILIVFITVILVSGVMFFFVKVNSDITSYLPDSSPTSEGQIFLRENFNMDGDFMIVVKNDSDLNVAKRNLAEKIEAVGNLDYVSSTLWIGDSTVSLLQYLAPQQYQKVAGMLVKGENQDHYIIICMLSVASSSDEAFGVLAASQEIFAEEVASNTIGFGGSVAGAKTIFDQTINAMPIFITVAIIVVLIILFCTMQSWLEPLILLLSIGTAIIINMGTDFFFTDISVITQACSAVLQIGLTMDYAIFLMHAYHQSLDKLHNPEAALRAAIPKTLLTISASALTTIGGFVAMMFMQMTIGMDLAKVLIKGIVISLFTIIMLQPILILMLRKPLEKGKHGYINLKFKKPAAFSVRNRSILALIAVVIVGVCAWGQTTLNYSYMKMTVPGAEYTESEKIAESMGNQLIVAVPYDKDKRELQYQFVESLENIDHIGSVLGLYSLIPENLAPIFDLQMFQDLVKQFTNNGYTMYTLELTCENETPEADAVLKDVTALLNAVFEDDYYIAGIAQAVYDLAAITPRDLALVSGLSAAIILVILLFSLRSVKKSVLVVLLIEAGIWLNLALAAIYKGEVNFVSNIAINAIQLGATVDYAILMCTNYKEAKKRGFGPQDAAKQAVRNSAMSIVTSASILIGACMSVFLVSDNVIVSEITQLIAIGAGISAAMVITFLPGLLCLSDINIREKLFGKKLQPQPVAAMGAFPSTDADPSILPDVVLSEQPAEDALQSLSGELDTWLTQDTAEADIAEDAAAGAPELAELVTTTQIEEDAPNPKPAAKKAQTKKAPAKKKPAMTKTRKPKAEVPSPDQSETEVKDAEPSETEE